MQERLEPGQAVTYLHRSLEATAWCVPVVYVDRKETAC